MQLSVERINVIGGGQNGLAAERSATRCALARHIVLHSACASRVPRYNETRLRSSRRNDTCRQRRRDRITRGSIHRYRRAGTSKTSM